MENTFIEQGVAFIGEAVREDEADNYQRAL